MPDHPPDTPAPLTVARTECPRCGALCLELETRCWQCGESLAAPVPVEVAPKPRTSEDGLIRFEGSAAPAQPAAVAAPQTRTRTRVTLTGDVVEVPEPQETAGDGDGAAGRCGVGVQTAPQPCRPIASPLPSEAPAASVGGVAIAAGPQDEVMVLTFCKACGQQNEEGARECRKCKSPLEVVAVGSVKDIEPLPRAWGFDMLGAAWIILGVAAIYCGQFLIKADPSAHRVTWADYFWTGVVACAPGILIFMRHVFCKVLFWVMTLGSVLVWSVIGFIWLFIGLQVSDNGEIGLIWLALLSGLSAVSFLTVRLNDAFDFTF